MPHCNYPNPSLVSLIKDIEKENILKDSNKDIGKQSRTLVSKDDLTPRTFKRVQSRENFIKYQWAWTL